MRAVDLECLFCGTPFRARMAHIIAGATRSCGCERARLSGERGRKQLTTHGQSKTVTYQTWEGMLQRTTNPNYHHFQYWGGRGIKVGPRWKKFQNFLKDMGERPPNMSLDRINNAGNYEPDNCRWATAKEQADNRG